MMLLWDLIVLRCLGRCCERQPIEEVVLEAVPLGGRYVSSIKEGVLAHVYESHSIEAVALGADV